MRPHGIWIQSDIPGQFFAIRLVSHNGSWPEKWMVGEGKPTTTWQQLMMVQAERVAQNRQCVVNKHSAKYSEVNGEPQPVLRRPV